MTIKLQELQIPLERDAFMRELLHHLSGALEDIIGLEEASGFISIVGQKMGENLNNIYKDAYQVKNLDRKQITQVLVDLKQRIQGDFYIDYEDDDKIVLRTHSCPFGEKVVGRPSLCMMTSNVFGTITADNLGYAKVSLEETIAKGNDGCKIVIYLNDNEQSKAVKGNEYFEV